MSRLPETQLRRLFRIVNGGTPTADLQNWDGEVRWATPVDLASVDGEFINETERRLTAMGLRSGSRSVPAGSLILSTRAPIGYVAQATREMAFNQGCRGLVPVVSMDIHYFRYQLSASRSDLQSLGGGSTFQELSTEALATMRLTNPDVGTQRAIADFLGAETARIDALIEKKREQATLINLRWIALVTDLVRGRCITSAHRRVSGVDWIEELPEEWGTPSVGMMFDVQLGKMLNQRAAEGENQHPYLRNQNVQWDGFDLNDVATMHFDPDESRRFTVRKGDLLVCEGGDVGRAAMWSSDEEIHYQKALHRVRPRTSAPPRFLMYVLWAASSLGVFAIEGNQSTIVHLTREQLRAHRIPWPAEELQRRIVAELDETRAKMRDLQERWAHQIQLLTERRQALITAAVTGRIEVPEAAASCGLER